MESYRGEREKGISEIYEAEINFVPIVLHVPKPGAIVYHARGERNSADCKTEMSFRKRHRVKNKNEIFRRKNIMAEAGISTLGITFGYGVETAAGTKPTAFTQLTRINTIGGITIEPEQIDASALEDAITRYVKGRADTGGTFTVTVNLTEETRTEWETLIENYQGLSDGKRMWFETVVPGFDDAFFVVAQPPEQIPQPEFSQNELLTVEMNLTIEEYKGMDAKVEFTAGV